MRLELKPHQKKALEKLSDGKILWGGTGSGKSKVAAEYYIKEHSHRDVYVITTAKKRDSLDWDSEFVVFGVGKERSATVHGVLCVDSWNNISKYENVENAFFIFDEQRLIGTGTWVKAFLRIAKKNNWIMLTATPGDTWLDYAPVFIANQYYKNITQFRTEHVIYAPYRKFPKVDRYVAEGKLIRLRKQILVHMPYEKETIRHQKIEFVDHDETLVQKILNERWNIFTGLPIRDIAELFGVMRRVVNSDPSRVKTISKLLKTHPKIIVFYNFNYELELLRKLEKQTTVAEWNGWKHEEIPRTDSWVYLVQYVAGSESWNCIETNATVFYSLTYSYKLWDQAHGRTDRMNSPFLDHFYYIFRSKSGVDTAIWRSLKAKKNFNVNAYSEEILSSVVAKSEIKNGQDE